MYSDEQLKIAESYSKSVYATHMKYKNEIKKLVTSWGKEKLEFKSLNVNANVNEYNRNMNITLEYPEFGAEVTLYYSEKYGLQYSKGSIGSFSPKTHKYQYLIHLLFIKLLEHHNILEEKLSAISKSYAFDMVSLHKRASYIKETYPGLLDEYFNSEMFKNRKEKGE